MNIFLYFPLLLANVYAGSSVFGQEKTEVCYSDKCSIQVTSPLELCRRQFIKSEISSVLDASLGQGWDNLQNLPLEKVFPTEYKTCQTTPDGAFLLPDDVSLTSVKHLNIDRMSKFYSNWEEYFLENRPTINSGSDFEIASVEISGSYDRFMVSTKQKFASMKASMLSTNLIYHAYTLKMSSTRKGLSSKFLSHLKLIHKSYVAGDENLAEYHANLLVQEFGTHLVTSVDLGARIEQNDYIDLKGNFTNLDEMKAAAASSFVESLFGMNSSVMVLKNVTEVTRKVYSQVLKYSEIKTHGGPDVGQLFESDFDGVRFEVGQ